MTEPGKKSGKSGRAILVAVLATIALSLGIGFGPDIVQKFREDGIVENGLSATGEILQVVDTGNRYNSNPEVEILLEITATNGKTWQARTRKVLTAVDLMSHQPGTKVRVMYDPEDPSRVVLLGPM